MKKFTYEAKDSQSKNTIKSTVQAESEQKAAKLLIAQGLTPITIEEVTKEDNLWVRISERITTKDKVVFTRQLSTLIAAGLPLSQSLHTLVDQTQNKRLRSIIQELIASVEGGHTLHESFAKHPEVFDKLFLALVAAGEASGTLDEALQRVAAQQEKDAAITSKIRGAMTYPIIVLVVIFGVLIFMLLTVVPQVEKLYQDLHQTLPFITVIIVSTSRFVINFWWLMLIASALGIYLLVQYLRTESGMRTLDVLKLSMPIFKGLFRRLYMARFCRTGETLLNSGVSMLDMMAIASEAVNNKIIAEEIDRASDKVKGGKDLSASLSVE
ncbi:type II secretion system F family protein, partial [Candidatus Saccharibacteria bacterium]|nr:type II secretion system F family protein [Candidatus Saccharibacteria bacterium]